MTGARREAGHPIDDVHYEMEAVEIVEHHHVEGGRRRTLFLVAAHVEVRMVATSIGEAVDEPGIAVVGEHDRTGRGEEGVELRVRKPVWVLALGLESHRIDDVDHPYFELG